MQDEGAAAEPEYGEGLPEYQARVALAEKHLGVVFASKPLLLQALVHRSFVLERERDGGPVPAVPSNERLEFLGDAVVGMLVAGLAFRTFPEYDEGRLTEVRSALVRRTTLALLAEELALGDLLYTGRAERRRSGKGYATVLAEAFEAVIAAIYLDQGPDAAERFLLRRLAGRVDELISRATSLNAKSRLQERAQATLQVVPSYTLVSRSGPPHESRFTVEAHAGVLHAIGVGGSIRAAEQDAARTLLELLESAAPGPAAEGSSSAKDNRNE